MVSLITFIALMAVAAGPASQKGNWYERAFYLLHEDHHTQSRFEVGRDADPETTARLIALSKPDVIQIHAKGNPGWTTYPTKIGHTPPKLARDVLAVWRDIAKDMKTPFSVYYNIGRDGVIMKRKPEWNRIRYDGKLVDRAICYHSGVAEAYLWPMVREIMVGYHPAGFWFDGSVFTIRMCYCDDCRERFRREHNQDPPTKPTDKTWPAFQAMQRQIYREFVRDTARMIHEIDPNCLVAFNWAYSLRMPEKPDPGIAYLTGDIGNRVEGLSPEAHWYDSTGLPFDLMTQLNTMVERKDDRTGRPIRSMEPKPRCQIEQEMAVILAGGGRYFVWDNPTPESGLRPERMQALAEVVEPFLRARQAWCLDSVRLPDASLLNDSVGHYAVNDAAAVAFNKRNNRIEGASDVLARLHINYEMLPDWRLLEGDVRSPVIIVEHPKKLTDQIVRALLDQVREGKTLLITGMGPSRDRRLNDACGIETCKGPTGAEPLLVRIGDKELRFKHWLFRVTAPSTKTLLAVRTADGKTHPLLTEARCGEGRALYAALPLLSKHGPNEVPTTIRRVALDAAAPPKARLLTTDAPSTVEVVLRTKGNDRIVHLVNMAPGTREVITTNRRRYTRITEIPPVETCRVSLRLPGKPREVRLEPQGRPLEAWRYDAGRLEMTVPRFAIHQLVVVRVVD